nr:putative reverse transcriptase domain-containing protein [Tanacetum cinerariifolium]
MCCSRRRTDRSSIWLSSVERVHEEESEVGVGQGTRGSFSDVEGQFVKCTNIFIVRWIQRVCSLLRRVESRIRLCTHERGKVIAYASRQLKIHEKSFTTHDLELGAVVFALKTYRNYLYGTKSVIYKDHKILQHTFKQKELNMRQRRWIELITDYKCEIRYHLRKENVVAAALRRKERVKPRRVENAIAENAAWPRPTNGKEGRWRYVYIWVPINDDVRKLIMDEAHASRLTKSDHFLAMREDYNIERLAKLYIDEIVARHGVPMSIILDRDGCFTSRFWQTLQKDLGTQLDMGIAYHPQMDGQSEQATDNSPAVPEHTTVETPTNMSPENKAHFLAEKEAIHLIVTRIGDYIYSTVDACQTAQEMWEAIERLQQESYYTIFYKLANEMIRNNLTVTMMQVNIQFLQQLQLDWSWFVTIVKQQHKLDEVSYHKLFDILKQYQNEVNELRAEKLARNANCLALVANAQDSQDPFYQSSSDPKQAQRDKDMQKNLALIEKYLKKIYKPTNNNLRTSSNSKNKNVDTTPRYKSDDHSGQFGTQRTVNVAGTREKVGSQVVQKTGIQCFNCKEYGHFAKEYRKPKRVKDFAYHKKKMLLCKQAEQGTDSEPLEQVQTDTGYNVFANDLQHSEQSKSVSNTCLVEKDDSNVIPDSPDMCEDDIQNDQNDVESDDERVMLANLISNLKLDVDENKKIQKKLKKANTTLAQELKECKVVLAKTSKPLGESISVRDSCLVALQTKQTEFEKYKAFNDRTIDYDKLEHKLNEALGQLAHKDTVIREEKHSISLEIALQKCKEQVKNDTVCNEKDSNVFRKEREQYFEIQDLKAQMQDKNIAISELKKLIEKGKGKSVDTKFDRPY